MSESWSHRHPTTSTVVGTLIAAGICAVAAQYFGWINLPAWPSASAKALTATWAWLNGATGLRNWVIAVAALAALGWIVVGVGWLMRNKGEAEAGYRLLGYMQDEFFGMVWRWQWTSDWRPTRLAPFCKQCDLQIDPHLEGSYRVVAPLVYRCSMCSTVRYAVGAGDTHSDDVERQVILLIGRRVRQLSAPSHTVSGGGGD